MQRATLTIEKRDASGKSPTARRVRKNGRVPGVMYHPEGNISFSADELEIAAVLRRGATLIDAQVDGKTHLTVLKEFQVHPVRGELQHVDLQAVKMDQTVRTTATLTLVGTSPGVKEGAILTQGLTELLIECKASEIPETIEFDISETQAGQTVILSELTLPEGVEALDDPGSMIISMTVPRGAKSGDDDAADGEAEGEEAATDSQE